MSELLLLLLSITPFAVFVYLLIFKKISLRNTSLATLGLVTLLVFFFWQIKPEQILVSYAKGFFVALDIFFIIAGAIFFLEVLKKFGVIESVSYYLESFSKDFRIQVILLAWFLENFIEGTAGFGAPGAVVAPLLVGLGIEPLTAAVLSLFGNSASVVFGASPASPRCLNKASHLSKLLRLWGQTLTASFNFISWLIIGRTHLNLSSLIVVAIFIHIPQS